MLPVLHVGPLAVPAGPFSMLLALYLALEAGDRSAKRLGLRADLISTVGLIALGAGLLAARLAYILANVSAYQLDWSQAIALNLGTLDPTAGAVVALLVGYFYLAWQKVNLPRFGDALAPVLALALAVLSLGNLLTGDAYGAVASNLPWAIQLWGEPRHPVQLYELALYLAVFAVLWFRAPRLPDGGRLLLAVVLVATVRLVLEPWRGVSPTWVAGMRSAQVSALVIMTLAALLLARLKGIERAGHE